MIVYDRETITLNNNNNNNNTWYYAMSGLCQHKSKEENKHKIYLKSIKND